MEIESGKGSSGRVPKVVAAVSALLLLSDFVVLRGEQVAQATIPLSGGQPAVLQLDRVGEEHLFEIDTRHRVNRSVRGNSVKLILEDPNGVEVYEESDPVSRKERSFRYTPSAAGRYQLHVEDKRHYGDAGHFHARVEVRVNDDRFLTRSLAWLPF